MTNDAKILLSQLFALIFGVMALLAFATAFVNSYDTPEDASRFTVRMIAADGRPVCEWSATVEIIEEDGAK